MANPSVIPTSMWIAALLVASQSFLYGYVFAALNSCLVTGDDKDGSHCFDKTDSSCPPGSIYNDIDLSALETQIATSLAVVGAWIGCFAGNGPSELYGRKKTVMINNL